MEFSGVIPTLQSAIQVEGGEQGMVRLKIDLYNADVNQLLQLRGKQLVVNIEPDLANLPKGYDEVGDEEAGQSSPESSR